MLPMYMSTQSQTTTPSQFDIASGMPAWRPLSAAVPATRMTPEI